MVCDLIGSFNSTRLEFRRRSVCNFQIQAFEAIDDALNWKSIDRDGQTFIGETSIGTRYRRPSLRCADRELAAARKWPPFAVSAAKLLPLDIST
jgi:hypothetical protein